MKKLLVALTAALLAFVMVGCKSDLDTDTKRVKGLYSYGDTVGLNNKEYQIKINKPTYKDGRLTVKVYIKNNSGTKVKLNPIISAKAGDGFGGYGTLVEAPDSVTIGKGQRKIAIYVFLIDKGKFTVGFKLTATGQSAAFR